jgi:hypothetical protein
MFKFAGGTLHCILTQAYKHCYCCVAGPEKTAHQQASPEQTHWTALHYATITGNYDVVRYEKVQFKTIWF